MRFLVLAFLTFCSGVVPSSSGAQERVPLQFDQEWRAALERSDARAAAMLDAGFEWTAADGHTKDRAEALGRLGELRAEVSGETNRETFDYGRVAVVTSARPGARMMRVWVRRPEGWRAFAMITTTLVTGTTPFAASGGDSGADSGADCENPCRSMPFTPATPNEKTIAGIFMQLKLDEWHPNPERWAPYVLDNVYYVTATARLSKADRVNRLKQLKETGAPSVPGDPVVSMRIVDLGDSAVMMARHNPYRGGQPYYSVRVWALRDARWQLANTQQTLIAAAPSAPAAQ